MRQWLFEDLAHAIVVSPIDDIIIHTRTSECVCAPTVENRGYHCICYDKLLVRKHINHHAMDGRA